MNREHLIWGIVTLIIGTTIVVAIGMNSYFNTIQYTEARSLFFQQCIASGGTPVDGSGVRICVKS